MCVCFEVRQPYLKSSGWVCGSADLEGAGWLGVAREVWLNCAHRGIAGMGGALYCKRYVKE